MNTYETVFIINPVLSEDQVKETVKKVTDYLEKQKAKTTHEENWGLKKLKYPIQNKKTGFYYLIEFEALGSVINNLEIEFVREERIIRWQTIKLEKFALEYSNIRKQKLNTTKK